MRTVWRWCGRGLVLLVLIGSASWNIVVYFDHAAHDPQVYQSFNLTATAMARVAHAPFDTADPSLRKVQVFVPSAMQRDEVLHFLTADMKVAYFDGTHLSKAAGSQALILLPAGAPRAERAAALAALGRGAQAQPTIVYQPDGVTPLFQAYSVGNQARRLLQIALQLRS